MEMFCLLWLLVSLVRLSPALPVSQEPEGNPADRSVTPAAVEMATGDLVPTHFPARRAAQVALHHLNTRHGSPFRVFGLQQVHKATAEDVGTGGRKYSLDFSVTDYGSSGSVLRCSADVLFPRTEKHSPPEVQLRCEGLQQISSSPEEEAFYQKHISPDSAVSAHDIPDSCGNISQDMKPFWHLARVAASFIMLRESSENTEYNMAQVANVSQQETSEKQLMLKYHVLLHDFVSQEIIHWKLLSSWSPDGGVRVLETEWQPKCPHATKPPSAN
ncbi:latexin isoform X1 [Chanodichthys erythropterus]|uniref:latexin isoform X1 n=2 Tax=Chanodichthys erythropterus TaxID=933992 RepID=UPI00351EBD73